MVISNSNDHLKFIYSEKATTFCKISTLLLTVCTVVKNKAELSQNFVAFSEYINFNNLPSLAYKVLKCDLLLIDAAVSTSPMN